MERAVTLPNGHHAAIETGLLESRAERIGGVRHMMFGIA